MVSFNGSFLDHSRLLTSVMFGAMMLANSFLVISSMWCVTFTLNAGSPIRVLAYSMELQKRVEITHLAANPNLRISTILCVLRPFLSAIPNFSKRLSMCMRAVVMIC